MSLSGNLDPQISAPVARERLQILLRRHDQEPVREIDIEFETPDEASRNSLPLPSNSSLPLPLRREEPEHANSTNAAVPNTGGARSSNLSWLLLAAAIIAITGLSWRVGRDMHSSSETALSPVNGTPLAAKSGADPKKALEADPAQAPEIAPSLQKEVARTRVNGALTKSLELPPATFEQATLSPQSKEPASLDIQKAESGMKPAQNTGAPRGDFIQKKLPNGVELSIPKSGIENKLLGLLEVTANKSGEFDLDRLSFGTAQTTLQPSSLEQLQNLAEILKAYPNTRIGRCHVRRLPAAASGLYSRPWPKSATPATGFRPRSSSRRSGSISGSR